MFIFDLIEIRLERKYHRTAITVNSRSLSDLQPPSSNPPPASPELSWRRPLSNNDVRRACLIVHHVGGRRGLYPACLPRRVAVGIASYVDLPSIPHAPPSSALDLLSDSLGSSRRFKFPNNDLISRQFAFPLRFSSYCGQFLMGLIEVSIGLL